MMISAIDYLAWRSFIADVTPSFNTWVDVDIAKRLVGGRLDCVQRAEDDDVSAVIRARWELVADVCAMSVEDFDTDDALTWAILADVIGACTGMCAYGLTAASYGLVTKLSELLDELFMSTCEHTTDKPAARRHRVTLMQLDLACGRGCAWVYFAQMCAMCAASEAGLSARKVLDAALTSSQERTFARFCELTGETDASRRFGAALAHVACAYDRHQHNCYILCTKTPDEPMFGQGFERCVREGIWWRVCDDVIEVHATGDDLRNYTRVYHTPAIVAVPVTSEQAVGFREVVLSNRM